MASAAAAAAAFLAFLSGCAALDAAPAGRAARGTSSCGIRGAGCCKACASAPSCGCSSEYAYAAVGSRAPATSVSNSHCAATTFPAGKADAGAAGGASDPRAICAMRCRCTSCRLSGEATMMCVVRASTVALRAAPRRTRQRVAHRRQSSPASPRCRYAVTPRRGASAHGASGFCSAQRMLSRVPFSTRVATAGSLSINTECCASNASDTCPCSAVACSHADHTTGTHSLYACFTTSLLSTSPRSTSGPLRTTTAVRAGNAPSRSCVSRLPPCSATNASTSFECSPWYPLVTTVNPQSGRSRHSAAPGSGRALVASAHRRTQAVLATGMPFSCARCTFSVLECPATSTVTCARRSLWTTAPSVCSVAASRSLSCADSPVKQTRSSFRMPARMRFEALVSSAPSCGCCRFIGIVGVLSLETAEKTHKIVVWFCTGTACVSAEHVLLSTCCFLSSGWGRGERARQRRCPGTPRENVPNVAGAHSSGQFAANATFRFVSQFACTYVTLAQTCTVSELKVSGSHTSQTLQRQLHLSEDLLHGHQQSLAVLVQDVADVPD
eukprot:Rhum_TRINITY_DN14246_c7_g1::Rhum_TRINITY_DN14246_c7_g1_i1::g.75727::m.75727